MRLTGMLVALGLGAMAAGCSQQAVAPPLQTQSGAMGPTRWLQPSLARPPSTDTKYTVLYSFKGHPDGANPTASLIGVSGTLYGTTASGGTGIIKGTVFSMSTDGTEHVMHSFGPVSDGIFPDASLIDVKDTLYGTTLGGGTGTCATTSAVGGCGTIYSVSPSGAERVVHSFKGGAKDGVQPRASLIEVKGTLYGTTASGGAAKCNISGATHSCGTVYSVSAKGKERVLYSFGGAPDGSSPVAGLIDVNGTLYGTTSSGGTYNEGAVFSLTTTGKEHVLYSFGCSNSSGCTDGSGPESSLIDANGTLYGTTSTGGSNEGGTVFSVTTTGTERVLYSFGSHASDGISPSASLIDVKGMLYGTTMYGGAGNCKSSSTSASGCGAVFSVSAAGVERILHSFGGGKDGMIPYASLIDLNGTLYGTTFAGGAHHAGTVFALKP
jgi:uncharacterized repeat protein (TIGR03803 family)